MRIQNPTTSRIGYLRLDKNENLVQPPVELIEAMRQVISAELISTYPELQPLYDRIAEWANIKPSHIFLVAGSDQAIKATFEVFVEPGDSVVLLAPTYAMFSIYCAMFQARRIDVRYPADLRLNADDVLRMIVNTRPKLACIANPNSPTSTILPSDELRVIVRAAAGQGTIILIDEAYYHFYPQTVMDMIHDHRQLVVTRTFSKALGLAASRVGFAAGHEDMIQALHRVRPMYEINTLGARFAELVLQNPCLIANNVRHVLDGKAFLEHQLNKMRVRFIPSYANFMLIDVGGPGRSKAIVSKLRNHRILIGGGFDPPLEPYIRVSIGPTQIMERFVDAFRQEWGEN